MVRQKKSIGALLILTLVSPAYAEYEQSGNWTPPPNFTGGLVSGGMKNAFSKQGERPVNRQDTGVIDRQINADQSGDQAGAGQGAANAAGAAMIATGVPMTLSIIPSVVAAGYTLIGMGITELAQGAASGAAKQANYAQGNLLENNQGQMGSQSPKEAAENMQLPPDLDNFLRNQGINPDDMARRAANGQLTNPDDIMNAFGKSFDPSDMTAAKNIVNGELAKVIPDEILKVDESNQEQAVGNGPILPGGLSGAPAGSASAKDLDGTRGVGAAAGSLAAAEGGGGRHEKTNGAGLADEVTEDILAKWGLAGANLTFEQKSALVNTVLQQNGVETLRKGENIFERANQHFRNFRKWRAKGTVARL